MRLIDADELVVCLRNDPLFDLVEQYGITGVIEAQPTVDAVPVIHCRNCKHRMHDKTCIKVMKRKPDDGFCDEGEVNKWEV